MTKPIPKKRPIGRWASFLRYVTRMKSWLHGAFCMAALVSFAANYCMYVGDLRFEPKAVAEQASQAPHRAPEKQISMADLPPTPAEAAKWGRK